jgi:hypothetical protein
VGSLHQQERRRPALVHDELLDFFSRRRPGPLVEDLQRAVDEFADMLAADTIEAASSRVA